MTSQKTIAISTRGHGSMEDLTERISTIVAASGIHAGIANVAVVGSTGAIAGLEFEPGLERDLPELLDRLIPPSRQYGHEQAWHDGNGHSHLQSSWLGQALLGVGPRPANGEPAPANDGGRAGAPEAPARLGRAALSPCQRRDPRALTLPVAEGRPLLGTWQQIVYLECDVRPRQRQIVVTVIGD